MGKTLTRLVFLGFILVVWEAIANSFVNPFWISKPSLIAIRLVEMVGNGDLLWHSSITVFEAALGLFLGMAFGIPAGLMLGIYRRVSEIVDPFVLGLYSLPRVALAPLFIMWFGIGLFSKAMLAFSLVVFIVVINIQEGVRNVDPELVDLMRTMRASRQYIVRRVLLPAIVPWIFVSLRIGLGLALIGAVVAEVIGASRGLGWYIEHSAGQFDTTGVFAGLVVLMIIAMLGNGLMKRFEDRSLRWRGSNRTVLTGM